MFSRLTTLRSLTRGFHGNAQLFSEHKVNQLEKHFLVWTKKYKSVEDVPSLVKSEVVEKARNRMRIRLANIMMVLTLFGCIGMIVSGRRARDRGESVAKMNMEWHDQYRRSETAKGN